MSCVNGAHNLGEGGALVVDAEASSRMGDRWRFVANRFQEPRHAVPVRRRAHQHRHDMAFAQFACEVVEHEVPRRVDVADELFHQRIVVVRELFQHRVARLFLFRDDASRHLDDGRGRGLPINERALEREIDEAGGDAVLPHGDLSQEQRRARRRLKHLERLPQAARRLIDLVEEKEPRHAEFLELAQNDLQGRNFARIRFADDDRGVADGQRVPHVVDEFDRAGAIEESQPVAHVVDAGDVGLDAHGVVARLGARIADARAFAHGSLPRQTSAARQDPLEKARLSALERADNGDEAGTGHAVLIVSCSQDRAPSSLISGVDRRFVGRGARGLATRVSMTRLARTVMLSTWSQEPPPGASGSPAPEAEGDTGCTLSPWLSFSCIGPGS